MVDEEWKAVPGWPYEASSNGRVRNMRDLIMTQSRHTNGYMQSWVIRPGERRHEFVHRLVSAAFYGEAPSDRPEVDHINHIRDDNRAENLRWLSVADNRARRRNRLGEDNRNSKLRLEQVRLIRSTPRHVFSDRAMAAKFGVSREQVRDIRLGKSWKHLNVE